MYVVHSYTDQSKINKYIVISEYIYIHTHTHSKLGIVNYLVCKQSIRVH